MVARRPFPCLDHTGFDRIKPWASHVPPPSPCLEIMVGLGSALDGLESQPAKTITGMMISAVVPRPVGMGSGRVWWSGRPTAGQCVLRFQPCGKDRVAAGWSACHGRRLDHHLWLGGGGDHGTESLVLAGGRGLHCGAVGRPACRGRPSRAVL